MRDRRFREVAYQLLCVAAVVAIGWYLFGNAAANLAKQDIATGFGYLNREAGFIISETPIAYEPSDSYARALLVGLLNTVIVALLSIVLGTIIALLLPRALNALSLGEDLAGGVATHRPSQWAGWPGRGSSEAGASSGFRSFCGLLSHAERHMAMMHKREMAIDRMATSHPRFRT